MTEAVNLKGLSLNEMKDFFLGIGEPAFRAKQLFHGLYVDRFDNFDSFTTFSKPLREKLKQKAVILSLGKELSEKSVDGTEKFIFSAGNGLRIETVWLVSRKANDPNETRKTICISSQSGCRVGCLFCATATLPFKGSLRTWQIIDQVIQCEKERGERATNIVFMGMGEPLYNYFSVMNAARLLTDAEAFGLGAKRITISTSGIIPGIRRFIDNKEPYNLAISLNHPDPVKRTDIMPIDDNFPLPDLLAIAQEYTNVSKKRITFEYIMISGVNMDEENIKKLVKIGKSMNCKFNLIPLNTDFNDWKMPTNEEILAFENALREQGLLVFNRQSPGKDINAACGMLALKTK